jgi:hypothetical protein
MDPIQFKFEADGEDQVQRALKALTGATLGVKKATEDQAAVYQHAIRSGKSYADVLNDISTAAKKATKDLKDVDTAVDAAATKTARQRLQGGSGGMGGIFGDLVGGAKSQIANQIASSVSDNQWVQIAIGGLSELAIETAQNTVETRSLKKAKEELADVATDAVAKHADEAAAITNVGEAAAGAATQAGLLGKALAFLTSPVVVAGAAAIAGALVLREGIKRGINEPMERDATTGGVNVQGNPINTPDLDKGTLEERAQKQRDRAAQIRAFIKDQEKAKWDWFSDPVSPERLKGMEAEAKSAELLAASLTARKGLTSGAGTSSAPGAAVDPDSFIPVIRGLEDQARDVREQIAEARKAEDKERVEELQTRLGGLQEQLVATRRDQQDASRAQSDRKQKEAETKRLLEEGKRVREAQQRLAAISEVQTGDPSQIEALEKKLRYETDPNTRTRLQNKLAESRDLKSKQDEAAREQKKLQDEARKALQNVRENWADVAVAAIEEDAKTAIAALEAQKSKKGNTAADRMLDYRMEVIKANEILWEADARAAAASDKAEADKIRAIAQSRSAGIVERAVIERNKPVKTWLDDIRMPTYKEMLANSPEGMAQASRKTARRALQAPKAPDPLGLGIADRSLLNAGQVSYEAEHKPSFWKESVNPEYERQLQIARIREALRRGASLHDGVMNVPNGVLTSQGDEDALYGTLSQQKSNRPREFKARHRVTATNQRIVIKTDDIVIPFPPDIQAAAEWSRDLRAKGIR